MCKEINKLIKITFVCIVHPRQHLQGENMVQDSVQCSLEACLMCSGTCGAMLQGSLRAHF